MKIIVNATQLLPETVITFSFHSQNRYVILTQYSSRITSTKIINEQVV